jgi:hypothetical protein
MAFGDRVHYGQIVKTYNVVDLRKDPAHRYSPGIVVSVDRERITGQPATVSTSFVERQNLTLRMGQRRFTRLTNGFSKKLENHLAAVDLFVGHYNWNHRRRVRLNDAGQTEQAWPSPGHPHHQGAITAM